MNNIEQYKNRFFNLMESTIGDVRPLIGEQSVSGDTISGDTKQIAGPFFKKGEEIIKYYVYEKGGKFYIYMTNYSQTTPKLMDGTLWSNSGKGYDSSDEANKVIQDTITSEMGDNML
jgi:hypothetical protein